MPDEEAAAPGSAVEETRLDAQRREAIRLYKQAMETLKPQPPHSADQKPDFNAPELSFQLMARLPADLEQKQALLQMRTENQRLADTISYLKKFLAYLKLVASARVKAGSNGKCR